MESAAGMVNRMKETDNYKCRNNNVLEVCWNYLNFSLKPAVIFFLVGIVQGWQVCIQPTVP